MLPICVPCERFYRPKKNGYYFIEGMPHSHPEGEEWDGRQGKDSKGWAPYKIHVGDLYECPSCHHQLIVGVGSNRVAEHYQPDFKEVIQRTHADQLLVKDCS